MTLAAIRMGLAVRDAARRDAARLGERARTLIRDGADPSLVARYATDAFHLARYAEWCDRKVVAKAQRLGVTT